eukprot:761392-Hanusia_phi.AAC.2
MPYVTVPRAPLAALDAPAVSAPRVSEPRDQVARLVRLWGSDTRGEQRKHLQDHERQPAPSSPSDRHILHHLLHHLLHHPGAALPTAPQPLDPADPADCQRQTNRYQHERDAESLTSAAAARGSGSAAPLPGQFWRTSLAPASSHRGLDQPQAEALVQGEDAPMTTAPPERESGASIRLAREKELVQEVGYLV